MPICFSNRQGLPEFLHPTRRQGDILGPKEAFGEFSRPTALAVLKRHWLTHKQLQEACSARAYYALIEESSKHAHAHAHTTTPAFGTHAKPLHDGVEKS
eukprot:1158144-Pelagomonas_calceolata.AAC.2